LLGSLEAFPKSKTRFALLIYPNLDKTQLDKLLRDHHWLNILTKPLYPSHLSSLLLDATHSTSSRKVKALLVEDNLQNQLVITTLLEALDCEVKFVSTGQQALACLNHDYDVIFMDLNLPDGNGIDITEQFKATSLHKETPIIAVTAHATDEDIERFIAAGGTITLPKPVGIESLKKVLDFYVLSSVKKSVDGVLAPNTNNRRSG